MTNSTPSNQPLPTPSIEALYSQEFPDTMSFDAISAKLDSMESHPAIAKTKILLSSGICADRWLYAV